MCGCMRFFQLHHFSEEAQLAGPTPTLVGSSNIPVGSKRYSTSTVKMRQQFGRPAGSLKLVCNLQNSRFRDDAKRYERMLRDDG